MSLSLVTLTVGVDGLFEILMGGLGLVLFREVWAAKPAQTEEQEAEPFQSFPQLTVLIPAHNEAKEIAATVQSLLPELREGDCLLVIADNCEDDTAEAAREAGAFVLERTDSKQRGKGYALEYGLAFLSKEPPAVIVFMDADCTIASGSLQRLAQTAWAHQRPVQSTYLMAQPPEATLRDQISAFALTLKNLVRPLGMRALGWPCLLTGSGMAIPWSLVSTVSLAGNRNADDMQFTVDLALQGASPLYEPRSRVTGRLMAGKDAYSQRTRWEHGHLRMILTQVPRLLGASLVQRRFDLLILALDMAIPPLSLFVLVWIGLILLSLGAFSIGVMPWVNLILSLGVGLPLCLGIGIAWSRFGRTLLPSQSWKEIPQYLLWKAPIYLRFITRPQTRWLNTERDQINK